MIMSLKQKKIKFESRIKWNHNMYVGVTTSRCLGNETAPLPSEERSERGLNSHAVIVIISAPKRGGGGAWGAAVVLPSAPSAQSG